MKKLIVMLLLSFILVGCDKNKEAKGDSVQTKVEEKKVEKTIKVEKPKIITQEKLPKLFSTFKDQETNTEAVIKVLGEPHSVVTFAHKESFNYTIDKQSYCFYFDGAGLIWAVEKNRCSKNETYIPEKSILAK